MFIQGLLYASSCNNVDVPKSPLHFPFSPAQVSSSDLSWLHLTRLCAGVRVYCECWAGLLANVHRFPALALREQHVSCLRHHSFLFWMLLKIQKYLSYPNQMIVSEQVPRPQSTPHPHFRKELMEKHLCLLQIGVHCLLWNSCLPDYQFNCTACKLRFWETHVSSITPIRWLPNWYFQWLNFGLTFLVFVILCPNQFLLLRLIFTIPLSFLPPTFLWKSKVNRTCLLYRNILLSLLAVSKQ